MTTAPATEARINLKPLMIAACYGADFVSTRIERWTGTLFAPAALRMSPSHVAVICEDKGSYLWVEATTMCQHPCLIRRAKCNGCQAHWPDYRVKDYVDAGGRVDLFAPVYVNRLWPDDSYKLTEFLLDGFVRPGVDYDIGGALISGTRIYKRSIFAPWADLRKVFCSELAAKACMKFGLLPLSNPAAYNPGDLIRSMLEIGTIELVKRNVQPAEVMQ